MSQSPQHEPTHHTVDHGLRRLRQTLVVLAQASRQTQPCEGPLHDPTARQNLESARLILLYWDQASVLVQVGLLNANTLPVVGSESARKMQDPASVPSDLLIERARRGSE
jgi:hypothetical protein